MSTKENQLSYAEMFLMFFIVGVIPFLVYVCQYTYVVSGKEIYDVFNLVKVRAIKLSAVLIILNWLGSKPPEENIDFKTKYLTKRNIFLGLIVLGTLIAFLFSDNKALSLHGAEERFEGLWIHLCYIIIFLFGVNYFEKEEAFDFFSYGVLLSTFVVGFIGTLQFFHINIFEYKWFIDMITLMEMNVTINSPGSYSTMYNINTSASYALLMMFLLGTNYFITDKPIVKKITYVNLVLIFVTFVNSFSAASYIGLAGAIFVLIVLFITRLLVLRERRIGLIFSSAFAVVIVLGLIFVSTSDKVQSKIASVIGPEATFTDWSQDGNAFYFYNKDDEYLKVETQIDNGYKVYEGEELIYTDNSATPLEQTLTTENFGNVVIGDYVHPSDNNVYINFNNYFSIANSGEPILVSTENLAPLHYVEFAGFEGYGNLFTNRGYIWSRSIPMVWNSNFIGYGSDTFIVKFPNDDLIGKKFNNQELNVFVDKPHNIYLNMLINNGILYLIGYLGIVVSVLISKSKLLFCKDANKYNWKALLLYISGIFAYLINGLSTDNLVIIIVLFWVYLSLSDDVFENKPSNNK